ncbi:MAG: hypothetical protein WC762_03055 [Methylobacter sp.]|jgi:hypothetical protein
MTASSILEISRSKRRYHDQDALLRAFIGNDGFTAKEVAVEVLDWRYEQYSNSPKRAFDLQKLGYLEQLSNRECRQTSKVAHTYRVTDKGREHLRKSGFVMRSGIDPTQVCASPEVSVEASRKHVGDIRSLLGSGG